MRRPRRCVSAGGYLFLRKSGILKKHGAVFLLVAIFFKKIWHFKKALTVISYEVGHPFNLLRARGARVGVRKRWCSGGGGGRSGCVEEVV